MRTTWAASAAISLCLVAAGLPAAAESPPAAGTFRPTGAPAELRATHAATLLADGRVLVIGGWEVAVPLLVEAWDPATETFAPAGSMPGCRGFPTATTLPDGRVFVVGGVGCGDGETYRSTTLTWDPTTETFSPSGSLAVGRALHTATLLHDGRVLVVGGHDDGGAVAEAEVWDPATGTWAQAGSLDVGRAFHTATLLDDGRVLVVGGWDWASEGALSTAEIWDQATASFAPVATTFTAREHHTATLLDDGRVLLVGGRDRSGGSAPAEIWDPATGTVAATGSPAVARFDHTATRLTDGRVLVIGGMDPATEETGLASAEIWDPATGTFGPAGSPAHELFLHTVTALRDGRVLVVGVAEPEYHVFTSFAEIWEPATTAR
jgi:hypothetical protein